MLTNLFFYFRTAKNVGHVDLFQRFIDAADFILREDNVGGAAIFLEAAQVRRTRDGDDPGLFAKHPGQGNLGRRGILLVSQFLDPVDEFLILFHILFLELGHDAAVIRSLFEVGMTVIAAAEEAVGHR